MNSWLTFPLLSGRHWLAAVVCAVTIASAHASVWYVDIGNTSGVEDGTSWAKAFTTIQPAIDAAADAGGGEVWVAEGVYDEERVHMLPDGPADSVVNAGSLYIPENVCLYGSFEGTEASIDARDLTSPTTVIDGSVARDGSPAFHVIAQDGGTIDGFVIEGGDAEEFAANGGAISALRTADIIVRNCIVRNNHADLHGGGIKLDRGSLVVEDCLFEEHSADGLGGAISLSGSTIFYCVRTEFRNNVAGGHGGAISVFNTRNETILGATIDSSVFHSNSGTNGGAVSLRGVGGIVTNCLFFDNEATESGGAVYNTGRTDFLGSHFVTYSQYINCTVAGNQAPQFAGMHFGSLNYTVMNCVVWDNGERPIRLGGVEQLINSIIPRIDPDDAHFPSLITGIIDANPRFVAPALGNSRLRPQSPAIDAGKDAQEVDYIRRQETVTAPEDDLEGAARPIGEAVDIGAYEFDPEAFVDPLDPSGDGMTNAVDIQMVINGALGAACEACDINGDGKTDAVDVQFIINAVLAMD